MEANLTLYQLSAEMAEIEAVLEANGGELTPELEKAMALNAADLSKKVDGYGTLIRKFAATSDICKAEIARIQAIKQTCDKSGKRLKDHIAETMAAFGIKSLEGDLTKVTLITSKATEVEDDKVLAPYAAAIEALQQRLPDYIKLEAKVSKTALKEKFSGSDVAPEGVTFTETKSLRIR